jgi:hypothetical protein
MCQFASFILTKNKVYWSSNSDSHEEIIRENGLEELDRETPNLVRVEIFPNEESLSDLDTWKFFLDQDRLPDWTFEGDPDLEERARKALKRRAREEKWFEEKTGQFVQVRFAGTAKAGDEGTAKAGNSGNAIAGDEGTAQAGNSGNAIAGDDGTAIAGYNGTVKAGEEGTAIAGDDGTAKAGNYGTAIAGEFGTASAGEFGTAQAGNYGTAKAGYMGTASAGKNGTASAGIYGKIMIEYYDYEKNRMRTLIGYVGEDGIEPNTPYIVQDGKLVKK